MVQCVIGGSMIKVFYNEKQTAKKNSSFSPSATKPRLVLDAWQQQFPIKVVKSNASTREDFYLAHDPEYVDGVLDLKTANGFGNRLPEIAESLPYTTGSFVDASIEAYLNKSITASPTSGFHHATYHGGGGYCTFNGLMVASIKLLDIGASKIGIIDFDQHYGNGQEDIIDKLELRDSIEHYTLGATSVSRLNADEWLDSLRSILIEKFSDCDVLLYQAGADCHINDPLGGRLTTEQMILRDKIVFEFARENNIGIAFNLAGGYQDPVDKVVKLHINTMREAQRVK